MKNILITPNVSFSKKRGYSFWIDKHWFDYAKKIKINLIIYDYQIKKLSLLKQKISGIILSGGNDLSFFKKNKQNSFRDKQETILFKSLIKKKVPILGVCRGFQIISKIYKGKIFKTVNHVKKNHHLNIHNNKFLNKKKLLVNSYHNYCIKFLPSNFEIIARHADNSIEAAMIKKKKVLCVMFHPERKNISQSIVDKMVKMFLIK